MKIKGWIYLTIQSSHKKHKLILSIFAKQKHKEKILKTNFEFLGM